MPSTAGKYDVVVVGAGPAGSAISRLLAQWDYRVLLLAGPAKRQPLAESLPPSIDNILELLGAREAIVQAGFHPDCGNTSWWGTAEPRTESYAAGARGYHVVRNRFDAVLLGLAEAAGVKVTPIARAPQFDLNRGLVEFESGAAQARFVVGATGRTGILARQLGRYWDPRYRTLAICASLRASTPWPVLPHHTLVEAYADGWAWSVPVAEDRRYVCFMVDSGAVHRGMAEAFDGELGKTRAFRELFHDSAPEQPPWACDASLYYARDYAGSNWLLAGDAGSAIDPLSSFGVKKALVSAWTGAVVINTCLSKPEMAGAAVSLYNERERQTYADHVRQAAHHFGELVPVYPTKFWRDRARVPDEFALYQPRELEAAFERLRGMEPLRLRRVAPVREVARPAIAGREVVMAPRAVLDALPPGLEYAQGVHLPTLAQIAEDASSIPDLFDAYNRAATPVGMPGFLAALSLLVARNALEIRGG